MADELKTYTVAYTVGGVTFQATDAHMESVRKAMNAELQRRFDAIIRELICPTPPVSYWPDNIGTIRRMAIIRTDMT